MTLADLIPTLQLAIGPVILISGVGLILLSMTNRLGRVIDRARQLNRELPRLEGEDHVRALQQLRILATRAKLVRAGIALAVMSLLLTAILIISLFLGALLLLDIVAVLVTLFSMSMLALIGSLLFFLSDINLTLKALWLELPPEAQPTLPVDLD